MVGSSVNANGCHLNITKKSEFLTGQSLTFFNLQCAFNGDAFYVPIMVVKPWVKARVLKAEARKVHRVFIGSVWLNMCCQGRSECRFVDLYKCD